MIYFSLPNFYENINVHRFLHSLSKDYPQLFKTDISFCSSTGSFPYSSWNGGINSNVGKGAYYLDFIHIQNYSNIVMPFRFNLSNVLLEDNDFYDAMNQAILSIYHDGSTMLEVSSIPLMEKIHETFPYYNFMFSKQADLITPFTPELLNQIIETNNFSLVGIPDKYVEDFNFLNQLKSKSKFELTVNPICPSTCENCDKCLFAEHVHQIEYSNKQDMLNCPNKKRFLNQDDLISLDMIQTNYLKKGFNRFTFSTQYLLNEDETVDFYIQYFIKPECVNEAFGHWLNRKGVKD